MTPDNHTKVPPIELKVNLDDLARKAVKYGPGLVLAETILNLCLMTNDLFKQGGGRIRKPTPGKEAKPK